MSPGATLFLVAAAMLLLECILWVPKDRGALVAGARRRFGPVAPAALFGNERGGAVLLLPVPPLGRALIVGGDGELPAEIDLCALDARIERWRRESGRLVLLGNLAWVWMFLVCPAVAGRFGLAVAWLPLLIGLLAVGAVTALAYVLAHRALYPLERWSRAGHALVLLLSPPATIRVDDGVTREVLAGTHPLVALLLLGDRAAIIPEVRRQLFDAGLLEDGSGARALKAVLAPMGERRERAHASPAGRAKDPADERGSAGPAWLVPLLARRQLSLAALAAPPERESSDSRSYCPRCHTQFRLDRGACDTCAAALRRF